MWQNSWGREAGPQEEASSRFVVRDSRGMPLGFHLTQVKRPTGNNTSFTCYRMLLKGVLSGKVRGDRSSIGEVKQMTGPFDSKHKRVHRKGAHPREVGSLGNLGTTISNQTGRCQEALQDHTSLSSSPPCGRLPGDAT